MCSVVLYFLCTTEKNDCNNSNNVRIDIYYRDEI